MGNGEVKELTSMNHGHELRWGMLGGVCAYRAEGNKREKNMGQL